MRRLKAFNRNFVIIAHDSVMAGLSFAIAVYVRLGAEQIDLASGYLWQGTLLFMLVSACVFTSMRLYRGLWRYVSLRDMTALVKAVSLSILIFAVVMFLFNRLEAVPRSVFFINWMLLLFMLAGPRFAYRASKDRTLHWPQKITQNVKIPVLLVGANDNAERFIRDMRRDSRALYEAVAIADDHPKRAGHTIHDVPIYGGTDNLKAVIERLERAGKRPQKLILTDDTTSGECVRHLLDISDGLGIPLARLPKASEIKTSLTERLEIQPIAVEDLLGRSQNILDRDSMRALVSGKRALITGAGGTIGGELTRQIASYQPRSLIIVELSEFNLYQIEREMRASFPDLLITGILADVRDSHHIERIFTDHTPELVFHAAAIKHVPISEDNVEETILTNVKGTRNMAEACLRHNVDTMLMISTDKAVNPTNVMGATKRLAESICQSLGRAQNGKHKTRFITVRFGNVLGSTGSVVPLFQEQLAKGGPITVTHPEMTRYFMTVREAVELVLQAAALGNTMQDRQECIFVLDMGQPVRIQDLAMQMIRLAGLKPNEDIKIIYTGLRPGEKLYEELFHFSENAAKTSHEGIFLASPRLADLDVLRKGLELLLAASSARNTLGAKQVLMELVPEFQPVPR